MERFLALEKQSKTQLLTRGRHGLHESRYVALQKHHA